MALILPDLNYDCLGCGKSCTSFEVEVTADEHVILQSSPVTSDLRAAGYKPLRVASSGRVFLGKEEEGRCTFLTPATRCSLHERQGYASKPRSCQDFPFHARPTPDGVVIGLSFFCSAVAQDRGRPLESRRAELTARFAQSDPDLQEAWPLWGEIAVDWATYLRMESFLARTPLLPGAARLAQVVRAAGAARLEDNAPVGTRLSENVKELVRGLLTLIEAAGESPSEMQAVMEALNQGGVYSSRVLAGSVDLARMAPNLPDWYASEANRYMQHLIFRKTLLEPPYVLSRACLLPLVAEALEFFTRASAQIHGRHPERDDFYEAAGILEGRLMLHTRGMESYFSHIGRVFLEFA